MFAPSINDVKKHPPLACTLDGVQMDQGRLAFNLTGKQTDRNLQNRIMSVLASNGIFSVIADFGGRDVLDVPLLNSGETPEERVKRTVRILRENSFTDPSVEQEVGKLWKAFSLSHHFGSTSKGRTAPTVPADVLTFQTYADKLEVFCSFPSPLQNVMLYDLYRKKDVALASQTGKLNQDLIDLASTQDFVSTPQNLNLIAKFTPEHLIPSGPDGLNPIDLALRSRNAALTRMIISQATLLQLDRSLDRTMLNAILREIENESNFKESSEKPWQSFLNYLKENGFTKNLSEQKQKELDAYICKLVNSATDLYVFLLVVLTNGNGAPLNSNDHSIPIWMTVGLLGDVSVSLIDRFERDLALPLTVDSLILERSLRFIIDNDPTMRKTIEAQMSKISAAPPLGSIAKRARQIARDLNKINAALGILFTAKHGAKWCLKAEKGDGLKVAYVHRMSMRQQDFDWFQKRLTAAGLHDFKFEPIDDRFQLVVSMPAKIEGTSTNSTTRDGNSASTSHQQLIGSASTNSSTSDGISLRLKT